MFKHVDIELPKLSRETIDGVRYYSVPDEDELLKLVSITSVTSHFNKEIFVNWRKRVGNEEADRITKASGEVGEWRDKLRKKAPGWNEVLKKTQRNNAGNYVRNLD